MSSRVLDERIARFRRPPRALPWILGHRGARAHAPENTMAAFDLALAQGAIGVELDVRMTADGQLCIAHDPHLQLRGHPREVAVSDLSGTQLRKARLLSGEPLPTLEEVLDWQKRTGALVNVELKGDVKAPLWMARRAAELVRAHGGDGILFSSFHVGQVRQLTKSSAEVPTALLVEAKKSYVERVAPRAALRHVAIHPQASLVTAERMASWRAQGLLVNVWTVNDPKEAVRLSHLGVDALVTDSPRTILSALRP